MSDLTEDAIEQNLIGLLKVQGYVYFNDADINPTSDNPQRDAFDSAVLEKQFQACLQKLNPEIPEPALHEAYQQVLHLGSNDIMTNNEKFHQMLCDGVTVEHFKDGQSVGLQVKLIDFECFDNNELWTVNQFVIKNTSPSGDRGASKRLDVILFINGLPLVVIELKSAVSEKATLERAYTQIQNYKTAIPSVFYYNALCIISDGIDARTSSMSAPFSRYLAWKAPQPPKGGEDNWNQPPKGGEDNWNQPPKGGVIYSAEPRLYGMLKEKAQSMRTAPTPAEAVLWQALKGKQLGVKFRQQHIVDRFIVDFCSLELQLIIEVDGEIHERQQDEDKERTQILELSGYRVIRFTNNEVLNNIKSVLHQIQHYTTKSSAPPLGGWGALPELEIMAEQMLKPDVLLKLIRFNTVFEKTTEIVPSLNSSQREGNHHYRGGMHFVGMKEQVRELRENQTPAEAVFWELVRGKKFLGFKFRRQHQIGHYIVDFYCHEKRLIIELDGEVHSSPEQQKKDQKRDKYLSSLGNTVLRFENSELLNNPEKVFQRIQESFSPTGRDGREGGNGRIEGGTTMQVVTIKKLAAYHQYYLVEKAVQSTLRALKREMDEVHEAPENRGLRSVQSQPVGDRKIGVVWHTQGSGKSLSMVFYAGRLVVEPAMKNPTIVILTDRNDLDDQLFGTFGNCTSLLRQTPIQASNRDHLKELLTVSGGGIVFTTIQKFYPENGSNTYDALSDRANIVVVADEAHRSQYGFTGKVDDEGNIKYGNAKHLRDALPHASFIGFTGTPIEKEDRDTQQVFGNYIDVYDIAQAIKDGATVPLSYESRLVKIKFNVQASKQIDALVDNIKGATDEQLEKSKKKNAQINAIIGHPDRLKDIAKDIVTHFEARQEVFEGKGMIVCMTRQIAVDLYEQITALKPEWHDVDLDKGAIKVVMTSSSDDPASFQPHHTNKKDRRALAIRLKDANDPLKLVIVQSMWLTGFDAPPLHTLYIDKKMQGAALMQAIARVNRVYKDKPGGLIVDYIGIGQDLRKAMQIYVESGGQGEVAPDIAEVIAGMMSKFEVVEQMFHLSAVSAQAGLSAVSAQADLSAVSAQAGLSAVSAQADLSAVSAQAGLSAVSAQAGLSAVSAQAGGFDYQSYFKAETGEKLKTLLAAQNFILADEELKDRFLAEVTALSKLYVMAVPSYEAEKIKDDVAFFQAIKSRVNKFTPSGGKTDTQVDSAIKQIVDEALSSGGVVDIFEAAGVAAPSLDILSEEFLLEVKNMAHKNLAFELLRKLLNDEVKIRKQKNMVQGKKFSEMLSNVIKRYHNNQIDTAQVIQELSEIARDMKLEDGKADALDLTPEEYAFYSILSQNDSTSFLEDHKMKELIHLIVDIVRKNATVDWNRRADVKAKLRLLVKKVLMRYGYPPDLAKMEADRVLEQSELLASNLRKC